MVHRMTERDSDGADIFVSHEALVTLHDAMSRMQGGFRVDVDEILWSKRNHLGDHQFCIRVELIQLNGSFSPRIPSVVVFGDWSVAALLELVRFSCETLVARGDGVDYFDLRRLLNQRGLKRRGRAGGYDRGGRDVGMRLKNKAERLLFYWSDKTSTLHQQPMDITLECLYAPLVPPKFTRGEC